ncbi:MAG TPA: NUDIX domain-containing protein [Gemmatimonadaceae bacterium]|nr:NUDIX domain-containing protein [Gemmatimonadaceae bacterium]
MTEIQVGVVDVYVIRPSTWQVLVLQRATNTRCPGSWETVHGHIEGHEPPEAAAMREVREETGLDVERLYNVTVQPFYLHRYKAVQLAVVFTAFVADGHEVKLGPEHQQSEWLTVDQALARYTWPRSRAALNDIVDLLHAGDAGVVEDVLRVR